MRLIDADKLDMSVKVDGGRSLSPISQLIAQTIIENAQTIESDEDKGEISDGYHTFNQLYHQRAVLFATIVNQNKDRAWKSFKHEDGRYCFDSNGEWFIVGVDTPQGSYTYHYSKEYWDMFKCQELLCGKHWDGHTEEDVTRLLTLESNSDEDCISRKAVIDVIEKAQFKGDAISEIEKLPSVTPKEKTGHWIERSLISDEILAGDRSFLVCSNCNLGIPKGLLGFANFCPCCRARMIKSQESEDKE